MNLKNNPFFILKIPCSSNRREIIAASENLSFILDPAKCTEAQNSLININRRLSSELDWFIDVDNDQVDSIRVCIGNNEPISTYSFSTLSELNATLYNFTLTEQINPIELAYAILDIDTLYCELDVEEIANSVNLNRNLARTANVNEEEISSVLNQKRDDIRQVISEKLSLLDENSYIEVITMLAEKCVDRNDYYDGVIIYDLINQHEVKMQSVLEKSTEEVEIAIDSIKRLTDADLNADNIDRLIGLVYKWDKLAQPLQLKSQASGMPHKISEHLGIKLRELALYLHNEKGKTCEALTLVNAMKEVFAELGSLSDIFLSDSDVLSDLLEGRKEAKKVLAEMDSFQKQSESLKSSATSSRIDSFINQLHILNKKLKALNLDYETKTKIRESLYYIARVTSVELHNTKHQTAYALTITKSLAIEFSDIPSLRGKINEDYSTLSQHMMLSNRPTTNPPGLYGSYSDSKSSNSGCVNWIVISVVVTIIFAIIIFGGSDSSSSTNPSNSSSINSSTSGSSSGSSSISSVSTETEFSNSSKFNSKVYVDIVSIFPEIGIYTQGSSNYSYFVCNCKTSSGSTVWVYMTVSEYKENFNSSESTSINSSFADEVTFSFPKRIHGSTRNAESIMSGLSTDTGPLVIDFSSIN